MYLSLIHILANGSTSTAGSFTHYGYTVSNIKDTIDELIAQGHTILGGSIINGPHYDGTYTNNTADCVAITVGMNTYCACPYQISFLANEYATVRYAVCIYYR